MCFPQIPLRPSVQAFFSKYVVRADSTLEMRVAEDRQDALDMFTSQLDHGYFNQ